MPQNVAINTVSTFWDFLEPAFDPNDARIDHAKIKVAGAGLTVSYLKGQVLVQKDDGTNEWAKLGTTGYGTTYPQGPKRVVKYPFTINELGQWVYGASFSAGMDFFESSIAVYYQGYFKTQDLVGMTTDAIMNQCGTLIRGTRTDGVIHLNIMNPVEVIE